MMKKIISVLMLLAVSAGTLCGCSGETMEVPEYPLDAAVIEEQLKAQKLEWTVEEEAAAEEHETVYTLYDAEGKKIAVVDSKAASGGEGFMVWQVLKKRAEGVSFDELLAFAEDVREHCVHFFTVQNLFHLYRGGRVSKTATVIGSGLNLKPVLHVDTEGRLIPIQKVMGRKASLKALVDDYVIKSKGWKNDEVWVQHGSAPEDAEWVAAKIKEKTPDVNVVIDFIGPIIGTHSGKGILAVFFLGEDKIKP